MRYRCAVATAFLSRTDANPEESATHIETVAHAMFAAERPADAPARDVAEVARIRAGIRDALHVSSHQGSLRMIEILRALLPPDEEGQTDAV